MWIYSGEVEATENALFLSDLMTLAKAHELSDLIQQCETLLEPLLNVYNCLYLYEAAYNAKANLLLERSYLLLSNTWDSVAPDQLKQLSPLVLRSILEKQTRFPLHLAIELQRVDVARSILELNTAEIWRMVNQLDDAGLSPLFLALRHNLWDLSEELLRDGADLSLLTGPDDDRQPTGHYALLCGLHVGVQFLVDHGYEVDLSAGPKQRTLLHMLAANGPDHEQSESEARLVHTLMNKMVDVSVPDADGNGPLHLSIMHHNMAIFHLFIDQAERFDLNATNHLGVPPLWLALVVDFGRDHSNLLRSVNSLASTTAPPSAFSAELIKAGADVNYCFHLDSVHPLPSDGPSDGDTLLMACVRCRLESAALFLLQHLSIADVHHTKSSGESVFHVAVESELGELCTVLATTYQCDPNQYRVQAVANDFLPSKISVQKDNSVEADGTEPVSPTSSYAEKSPRMSSTSDYPLDTPFDCDSPSEELDVHTSLGNVNHIGWTTSDRTPSPPQPSARVERRTPLHLALPHGMVRLVELYLDRQASRDADWFSMNEAGDSVLSLALWSQRFDLANRILIAALKQYQKRDLAPTNMSLIQSVLLQFSPRAFGPSLLHRAVECGRMEVVRFLLQHEATVNDSFGIDMPSTSPNLDDQHPPDDSNTRSDSVVCPLWCALLRCDWNIASLLISHGADVNFWSSFKNTPIHLTLLHRAVQQENEPIAQFLIENNCDVNAIPQCPDLYKPRSLLSDLKKLRIDCAWTPLHMCASIGLAQITHSLLECGRTDVNHQDLEGNTALHIAVRAGHTDLVKALLRCPVLDCTVKNVLKHTPFHVAMECRHVKAAQALLERDPTLALQTDDTGMNFLHVALQNKDRSAVFLLIQAGMDMNQCVRDSNQHTPLHLAIIAGVPDDVFRSLLLAGASMSSRTPQKYTPLHLCVIYDRPELLQALIENGADVNEQDSEMNTPLHLAIRTANIPCLTILLACPQTDCHIMNIRGQLGIHLLAEHSPNVSVEILQHLLEVCVALQVNAKDASGNTPLLLAYRANNVPLCIALVHAGALLGSSNVDGHSIFTLSRMRYKSSTADRTLAQILDSLVQEPRWEDGVACVECSSKFGLSNRKHHCRHCGRLLCSQCSSFWLPVVKFGLARPVRVCGVCYEFLNNPLGF